VVGLKKEFVPADQQNTFIDMTPMMDAPLADILKGESLCEFPIFHVWIDTAAPTVTLEEKSETPSFRGLHTLVEQSKKPVETQPVPESEAMDESVDTSAETASEEVSSESEEEKTDDDDDEEEEEDVSVDSRVEEAEMGETSQVVEETASSDIEASSPVDGDQTIATPSI